MCCLPRILFVFCLSPVDQWKSIRQIGRIDGCPEKNGTWGKDVFLPKMLFFLCFGVHDFQSGQIIATSHDLTPNGGLVREIPLFQGNLGW